MQLDQWNIQTHGLEGENHYLVAFHGIQAQVRKRQIGPNRLILQFGDNHASFFDDYREDGVVIQLKPPDRCTHAVASAPQVLAIITHNMRRRANPPALKLAEFPEFPATIQAHYAVIQCVIAGRPDRSLRKSL